MKSALFLFAAILFSSVAFSTHDVKLIPIDDDLLLPSVTADDHISVSVASLDFGSVDLGSYQDQTVEITNQSSMVQTVSLEVTDQDSSVIFGPGDRLFTLPVGMSRIVTVTYRPVTMGDDLESPLVVAATDSNLYPEREIVQLSGTTQPISPEPVLAFAGNTVTAYGQPGSGFSVVLFGVSRQFAEHSLEVESRREILTDSDLDGIITFDLGVEVSSFSVWFAVDLSTASYSVAAPGADFPVQQISFPEGGLPEGNLVLTDSRTLLEVVLVKPNLGAYFSRVADGGTNDQGGLDGSVVLPISDLQAFGGSPANSSNRFVNSDLILVVDGETLEVYATVVESGGGA